MCALGQGMAERQRDVSKSVDSLSGKGQVVTLCWAGLGSQANEERPPAPAKILYTWDVLCTAAAAHRQRTDA